MDHFIDLCVMGDKTSTNMVRRIVSKPDFDPKWITCSLCSALYYACSFGHSEIVEILLKHVNIIPISYLRAACIPTNDKVEKYLKILKLLFEHGNFDEVPIYNEVVLTYQSYFGQQVKILFDEYEFRLDGPKYNENILTY